MRYEELSPEDQVRAQKEAVLRTCEAIGVDYRETQYKFAPDGKFAIRIPDGSGGYSYVLGEIGIPDATMTDLGPVLADRPRVYGVEPSVN